MRTNFIVTRKVSLSVKIGLNDRKWSIRPLRNFTDLSYMKDAEKDNDFFTHGLKMAKFQQMPLYFAGECRQLFLPAYFTFGNRRLMKHVYETMKVHDFNLCELQCYHQPNCVSINFNVIPDSKGLHECELNNATHRSHENELENKEGYIYKGAEVRTLNLLLFKSIFRDFSSIRIGARVLNHVRFVFKIQLKFVSFSCSRSDSPSLRIHVRVPIHDC